MMKHAARWFGLTLFLLAFSALAWGQDTVETPRPVPRAASARKEANLVRVNGKRTVLLWAAGLTAADDLDSYAAAGFNTLAVPLTDLSKEALTTAFDLASAAEEKGLLVIGVLSPEKLVDENGKEVAFDPLVPGYSTAVRGFVQKAVDEFGRHPRLIAWVVDLDPSRVVWGDAGFQQFLGASYRSLDDLNNSWGSEFADLSAITTAGVRDLDGSRPGNLGRASVDYAYYRQKTYADAVGVWAKALGDADSRRLVLAGGLSDYRSAIGLESGLDGLVMETTSARAESDYATANVQAVDIARRANRLIAVQTLDVSAAPAPTQVRNWVNLALLHGASGMQFRSWADLKDSEDLRNTVKQVADMLAESTAFPTRPVARAAVLYEPYAGGAMRNGNSLYGYLDGSTDREPTDLFFSVRNGSRYGLMDVLSLDTLANVDLADYGAVLVPMGLFLPDKAQLALNQFAMQGGVLVADAGAGMYQAKGVVGPLPDILRDTFGMRDEVAPSQDEQGDQGNPNVQNPYPSAAARPGIGKRETGKFQRQQDLEDTIRTLAALLDEPDVSKTLGVDYDSPDSPGLRTRKVGKGIAVYAPAFLYQQWSADSDGYVQFHDHVLGWHPDVRVSQPDLLWPSVEVSPAADGSVNLVTPGGVATSVRAYGVPNELFLVPQGAVRVWDPTAGEPVELLFPGAPLATALPLPLALTPQGEGTTATVVVRQYDAQKIDLEIHGSEATASPSGDSVAVSGGGRTRVEIVVGNGAFPVSSGQSYHIVVEDNGRPTADYSAMPSQDTGVLTITGDFRTGRVTITPAAGAESGG